MNNPQNNIGVKEVININNIFFEDSFIDLINLLSKIIKEFYFKSTSIFKSSRELLSHFETNISYLQSLSEKMDIDLYSIITESLNNLNIIKDNLNSLIKGNNDNLTSFCEKAKEIFKEMNKKKNISVENIYNDYARKHSLKNEDQRNNLDISRRSNNMLGNKNTSNKNLKRERNKTINKTNTENRNNINNQIKSNINIPLINKLIKQLGEFNTIIKNQSVNDGENFIKIQKQIIFELNKSFNHISKSVERKNQSKGNMKEEKNPFIMVNNNNNNVTMTTTNNNNYYNIIDKTNLKEIESVGFQNFYNSDDNKNNNNDINIDKNKNINLVNNLQDDNLLDKKKKYEYDKIIKKLNEEIDNKNTEIEMTKVKLEEMEKLKDEYELKYKVINDKNTSLSKCLVDKNHEIQQLQNNNKQKANELTKLKLIVKNNEKQLKVKKLKADQQKEKNNENMQIKDLLGNKKRGSLENNEKDNISSNISKENLVDKKEIDKLEEEIGKLKDEITKKEVKIVNLENNINKLESENNEKEIKNELLNNKLINKDIKITEDDKIINNLKNEKDKYIKKLKDFKNLEESYQLQINSLKTQIKEMIRQQKDDSDDNINKKDSKKELKKKYNDLVVANLNLKNQLEYELNSNKQLKAEVKNKDEQIDGLNLFIGKLMSEKEKNIMENMKDTNKGRVNTDSGHKGTQKEESSNKKNNYDNKDHTTD